MADDVVPTRGLDAVTRRAERGPIRCTVICRTKSAADRPPRTRRTMEYDTLQLRPVRSASSSLVITLFDVSTSGTAIF